MGNEQHEIGIVCGQCDTWSSMGATSCTACDNDLALFGSRQSVLPTPLPPAPVRPAVSARPATTPAPPLHRPATPLPAAATSVGPRRAPAAGAVPAQKTPARSEFADLSQEELMEQARNYVCRSCSSGVPSGHKFCGRCGTAVPLEIMNAQTLFFGDMQNPAKAKLILIRGEGMDGLSFHLKAEQHIVGRNGQLVFPDDPFVSPKHANFFYRDGKLVVRDEGSLNGVYIRVRGTVDIVPSDTFLAGEQLFRLDSSPSPPTGRTRTARIFIRRRSIRAPSGSRRSSKAARSA
ncbi:FHA domain-containing protein [Polyangium mundeleinium]|uniref:FHA domain-containing protein n=1 Tax=Polyangium mundeleinium TaxID=2995306 RepID=A0ABT5F698_9BACT|nr:FHA domain-containing protein [Polyangium mundeleinium]MDC0749630.1 FHA domain-containing protein [Polyangium mundeleinium]